MKSICHKKACCSISKPEYSTMCKWNKRGTEETEETEKHEKKKVIMK